MDELTGSIDRLAADTQFSGVVRIDVGDDIAFARAYGLANRAYGIPNAIDTQFGIASGTKGLTALTVVGLIEDRLVEPGTTARSVLGPDLPLIADDVTIEHLLAHRSGIGDFLDEELDIEIDDRMMPVSVHELRATEDFVRATEDFVRVLDGFPQKFPPGERSAPPTIRPDASPTPCWRTRPRARGRSCGPWTTRCKRRRANS